MKKLLLLLMLSVCVYQVSAQINDLDSITNADLANKARQEVNLFTDKLASIVSKRQTPKNRERLKKDALSLFIGKGLSYFSVVYDSIDNPIDTINHDPVKMQTTSLRRPIPRDTKMIDYLSNLVRNANNKNYITVSIKTTEWKDMKVSDIQKLEDGKYILYVYFEQWYKSSYGDTQIIYKDYTRKRVTCFIDITETDRGKEVIIKLGDVEAEETNPYETNPTM